MLRSNFNNQHSGARKTDKKAGRNGVGEGEGENCAQLGIAERTIPLGKRKNSITLGDFSFCILKRSAKFRVRAGSRTRILVSHPLLFSLSPLYSLPDVRVHQRMICKSLAFALIARLICFLCNLSLPTMAPAFAASSIKRRAVGAVGRVVVG